MLLTGASGKVGAAPAAEAEPPGFDSLGLDARIRRALTRLLSLIHI